MRPGEADRLKIKCKKLMATKRERGDFPGGTVVKTPRSQ